MECPRFDEARILLEQHLNMELPPDPGEVIMVMGSNLEPLRYFVTEVLYKKGLDVKFHRFPKNELMRNNWVIAIRRKDYKPSATAGDITDSNYTLLIAQVPEKEDKLVPVIPCNCTCPYKALLDITVPEAGPAGLCSVVGFHVLPRETIGKCMVLHGLPTSWLASPSKQVLILPKTKFLLSTYTDT
ncbi:hypothetical protein JTB14_025911 [Gonioctena quinquepunctata]|nr:hypothetical protein JTB14_025911 [Gonioctena quinquepunctata]